MESDRNEIGSEKSTTEEYECPRAQYDGKTPATFDISKDPAVQEVARMIVAGVDKEYELHPRYQEYIKAYGKERAQKLIRRAVEISGDIDIIQTEMDMGGVGLFGGLSEDSSKFVFYEWSDGGQMTTSMTAGEARDILEGRKKEITFYPVS